MTIINPAEALRAKIKVAMKDENKEAAAQKKSPTSGMTLWQRIGVMAVNALIRHVLRDIKPGLKAALEAELAAAAKNQQET